MPIDRSNSQPKPFGQVDVSLYPDLVEQEGLLAALEAAVQASRLDVGQIGIQYPARFAGYTSAAIETGRGRLTVNIALKKRMFSISLANDGLHIATGASAELVDVLTVASAWRAGISLDELETRFPFMQIMGLARVLASADPVAAQWDWLRHAPEFSDDRQLVDFLYDDPALRSRFPELSHRSVWLSTSFGVADARVVVSPLTGGKFRVELVGSDGVSAEYSDVNTATGAASELVRRLDSPGRN